MQMNFPQDFQAEVKTFFIVALVAILLAVAGILLLGLMNPAAPVQPSSEQEVQEEILPQRGISVDNVEIFLSPVSAKEGDEYRFSIDARIGV